MRSARRLPSVGFCLVLALGAGACTSDLSEKLNGLERQEPHSSSAAPDAGNCNGRGYEISTDSGSAQTCGSCKGGAPCSPSASDPSTSTPSLCAPNTWDHDQDPSTPCQAWAFCAAGQYVIAAGSDRADRICAPCPAETYSDSPNQSSCEAWTPCRISEAELRPPTPSADRVCAPYCGEGDAGSGSQDCLQGGPCAAGEEFIPDQPDAGATACRACKAGQYCAGGAERARSCADGTWDHDADPSTPCRKFTQCPAGDYIAEAGSALVDRQCDACADGSFSAGPDAARCTTLRSCEPGTFQVSPGSDTQDAECAGCPAGSFSQSNDVESCTLWSNCQSGSYVSAVGSAVKDRECSPCPVNTSSDGLNLGACVAEGECAPGSVRVTPLEDDGSEPASCEPCEPGDYCAGAKAEAVHCAEDTWDDDGDPATPCSPKTPCAQGEHIDTAGDALTDRQCAPCADGEFSTAINAESCSPWKVCALGTYAAEPGSSVADRVCEDCSLGSFSNTEDAPSCTLWATCAAPLQYVTNTPSATLDRICDACEPPEESLVDNAPNCVLPTFQMSDGTVVFEAEHYHELAANGSQHTWELTSDALASGGECMRVNPEYGYQWTTPVGYAPELSFRVNFTSTGTFYLNLKGDAGSGGGGSDSCFVGVDDSAAPVYDFDDAAGVFGWRQQTLSVTTTGSHVVSVWASEDGFCADKIVISAEATLPSGAGPAESPRG